jgi:hypothetical protein
MNGGAMIAMRMIIDLYSKTGATERGVAALVRSSVEHT